MTQTFRARQMVPRKDTISVMALHYGLKPSDVRDIIRAAGAPVIREDGFKGYLHMTTVSGLRVGKPEAKRSKVFAWSDGMLGVNPDTTKLTRKAILAVARWKFEQSLKNDNDN